MKNKNLILVCGISRSGTTLLSSLLNTSESIVTFAELIPVPEFNLLEFNADNSTKSEFKKQLKKFLRVKKITDKDVYHCNEEYIKINEISILKTPEERIHYAINMAYRLVDIIDPNNISHVSLKLNNTSFDLTKKLFPEAKFIFIERGLTDNIQSHINADFKKTEEKVKEQWNIYSKKWFTFMQTNTLNCLRVKYENLAMSPLYTSRLIFKFLNINFIDNHLLIGEKKNIENFTGHINFYNLSKGISSDNVPYKKIDKKVNEISSFKDNFSHTYSRFEQNLLKIKKTDSEKMDKVFLSKRKHNIEKYTQILEKFKDSINLRIFEFNKLKNIKKNTSYIIIRHDIDHDIKNAVKLAKIEHSLGLRATYCILHSAWYYGELNDNKYIHSNLLMDACYEILAYGHEINFHNNLAVYALKYGIDIEKVLHSEIDFFYKNDIPIIGSSTHGDKICKELKFRNWEIFDHACDDRFGGPRKIKFENNEVMLGQLNQKDFGLEYEAYDFLRNYYLSDSGGNIREHINARGRDRFPCNDKNNNVNFILTHPIWWQI